MLDKVQEIVKTNRKIEEKISQLREDNCIKEAYIKKWRTRVEIENMMGRFALLYSGGQYGRLMDYFADCDQIYLQRSDVGIYEGRSSVARYFESLAERAIPGSFRMMNLTSPVIQVAGDGQTAQGMWFNNGLEAIKDPSYPGNPAVDMWINDKVAAEFIQTGRGWRILRLTICEEMRGLFHKSWGEYSIAPEYPKFDVFPEPDHRATKHLPFRMDRKSKKNLTTPEPYESYENLTDHF